MNIALVIVLPDEYKLDGVILSTILSFVFIQIPWESHVMFTCFFGRREAAAYWRVQAVSIVKAVILAFGAWAAAKAVPLAGGVGLVVKGAAAGMFVALAMCILFFGEIKPLFSKILRRKTSK